MGSGNGGFRVVLTVSKKGSRFEFDTFVDVRIFLFSCFEKNFLEKFFN